MQLGEGGQPSGEPSSSFIWEVFLLWPQYTFLPITYNFTDTQWQIWPHTLQVALQTDVDVSFSIDNFDPSRFHDIHCLLYAGASLLYAVKKYKNISEQLNIDNCIILKHKRLLYVKDVLVYVMIFL